MGKKQLNDSTLLRLSKAAHWLQRLHQSPDDGSLVRRCRLWCAADPANAVAFERMETVWQAIGQLATIARASADNPEGTRPTARALAVRRPRGRSDLPHRNGGGPPLIRSFTCTPDLPAARLRINAMRPLMLVRHRAVGITALGEQFDADGEV
jgi:hypothetical protein